MATYNMLPADLPKTLRSHGLKVVVVPGWRLRKTQSWQNGIDADGILIHHTATPKSWSITRTLNLLLKGRPGLSGPLCQLGLGRDGTVYILAAGRANHAGNAKASGSMPAGDGNYLYVGIEGFNDGEGEPWPTVQYDAYVLLSAVLGKKVIRCNSRAVRGHKETSTTDKVDPRFDMDTFRNRVQVKLDELGKGVVTTSRGEKVDHALKDLKAAQGAGARAKNIQAALAALSTIKPLRKKAAK